MIGIKLKIRNKQNRMQMLRCPKDTQCFQVVTNIGVPLCLNDVTDKWFAVLLCACSTPKLRQESEQ